MPFLVGNLYYIRCSFIVPPHEKISICVCDETPYFLWVNTNAKFHGIAQVLLPNGVTPGITHDSYADLSELKMASPRDLQTARDFGPITDDAKELILAEYQNPIRTLSEQFRQMVLQNLS
jgi:hypothetical protein